MSLFAYSEGGKVYTESYFPDGSPVKGGVIKVYDSSGKLILKGKTDNDGLFNFKIPVVDDLKIVLEASMGHRAEFLLNKDELVPVFSKEGVNNKDTEIKLKSKNEKSNPKNNNEGEINIASGGKSDTVTIDAEYIRKIIREEISEELKPIARGIAKIQEEKRPGPNEIIGGIGYILGLVGISMYFLSRRRQGKNKDNEDKQS